MKRILSFVAAATLLTGCGKKAETAAGPEAAPGRPVVALVVKTLNHPFFIDMQKGAEEAAKAAGVELIVQAAEREIDVERQMQIIENLIQRKVNALVVAPSGSREIVPVVVKANQAGIPVLVVDTRVDAAALRAAGGTTATFIGSDNYEGGKLAGEFMAQKMGGQPRHADRRLATSQLGARPRLQCLPEHHAGAPRGERHVCGQRPHGAGRA